ncbi:peptide ABC transporter substrate-binding protein [Deinococcus piscis]|uniref:Peptide ABC transporter substrate-binding protein n=1 Tax=Deinococcus piscis TaxID=394230 RepID=A0ABQ3K9G4_9DEIO|nr:ABC transporter substrate-binding protein [Deinococcus piscis]GHG05456.1 peptide ABC transporter substrate-binding protein [Deinococcus piscis]
MTQRTGMFLTLALLLAGCTAPKTSGDSGATASGVSASGAASADAGAPAGASGAASAQASGTTSATGRGDTLVIMEASDIPTLDPGAVFDGTSSRLVQNAYETLVAYPAGSLTEYEPLLAESWTTSEDGLQYRFKLRSGVKFHSGNPFSCADAEYTFERNLVTNAADGGSWYISEPLLGTRDNAEKDPSITWKRIDQAVECEGEELVLNLAQPEPYLLARLTYPGQAIVDRKHTVALGEWDGTEATWKDWVSKDLSESPLSKDASGTGPYRIVSAEDDALTFVSFPDYWGGEPAIKNVVRRKVPEQASRIQALLKGDTDIAEIGSREVIQSQVAGQPGIQVVDDLPNLVAYALALNQDTAKSQNIGSGTWGDGVPANFFADRDMRLCFVKAFDYDTYVEQIFLGKAERRNTLMPPQLAGYDQTLANPGLNLDEARQHCEKAHGGEAWEKGFTLNAAYREGSPQIQAAIEILKMNIEAMNPKFKVNLIEKQWSELISAANIEPMAYASWGSGYADPDNYFRPFYHSAGYHGLKSHINDAQIDSWIDEARKAAATDPERAGELYAQVARRAAEEGYYIVLPIGAGIQAYRDDLRGVGGQDYNVISGLFWKRLSKGAQ